MKETKIEYVILYVILGMACLMLVVLFAALIIQGFTPILCDAQTSGLHNPHSWSFLGGCKVQLDNGDWVLFSKFIINVPQGQWGD